MKRALIGLLVTFALATQVLAQGDPELKDRKDKISYSVGVEIGTTLKKQGIDVSADLLTRGIRDALSEAKTLMTEEEMVNTLTDFRKEFMAKKEELNRQLAEKNKKEEEAFLAENQKKEGVKTLPSGLQYKVIKPGTGRTPKAEDMVTVQYRGTLIGGKEFDSSYSRGKPATFLVNRVIPGWTEVLQLMQEGAKWEVVIPSQLAYGEHGAGTDIGPNSALIFEIELISVQNHP
jgi:FKBP-type peptidyl-prolyl cis-trans isomerase FklB